MFDRITLHGDAATLLWGYRAVAVLTSWRIARNEGKWTLSATLERADSFQCRSAVARKELLFTAPRDKGRWCWPLTDVDLGTNSLRATLGQPLQ